jgi:(2Fe-2S) ferredoxin
VLLACLWSPYKESELHTDLVPILLGFRSEQSLGREIVETHTEGNRRITRRQKIGYLTDTQFRFACRYVDEVLAKFVRRVAHLGEVTRSLSATCAEAEQNLRGFEGSLAYLDAHPRTRMNSQDAARIVELHTREFGQEWKKCIVEAKRVAKEASGFVWATHDYSVPAGEQLKAHEETVKATSSAFEDSARVIATSAAVVRKHTSFGHKLATALRRHP